MVEDVFQYINWVTKEIAEKYGYNNEIPADEDLINIGIDSLDIMEIIMGAENRFHIKIDDKKIVGVNTINKIVELIKTAD